MKKFRRVFIIFASVGVFGLLSFDLADNYFEISKNLEIFASIYKELNTYYVDDIEPAKLVKTGIDAMLKSLDPYTNYISESEIEDYRFMTTGQYGGIGAQIAERDGYVMVREPYDGWPAQKADLRAGDIITEIDGKSTKNRSTDDVSKLLKGQPDTEVKLLIKRQGETKEILKIVKRQEIKVKNVPYSGMINKNIGYIKFTGFRQEAASEVREALVSLRKDPEFKALVLDLRGNPGGLLDEAIKSVNIFVDKGQLVVSTKGKMADWNKEYNTDDAATDLKTPIVILTDKGSASASEIVTGSLQDLDRAVVVGENSYGKGLVQTTRPLPYGTQLKVTTSKYYIPSGRCIQAIDYSHRDNEGKALKTADSLKKKEFRTKGGRLVFAGSGIKPDLAIDRKKYADVVISLNNKFLFFDYATNYKQRHESIPEAAKFKLTDQDWTEFMNFLKGKEYEYTTETEETLKKLEKTSKEEKYYDAIKAEIDNVQQRLKADKQSDVEKYKVEIKELIEDEIASRYYYQKGRVQASFDDDPDIQEAIRVLSDPERYQKILTAGK
jgi:carboxyl-terminal processing protease